MSGFGVFSGTVYFLIGLLGPNMFVEGECELSTVVHRKQGMTPVLETEKMDRCEDVQELQSPPG